MRWRALMLKEWRLLLRDRHALAVLFIMPSLFLLLMALAMGNINLDRPPQIDLQLSIAQDSEAAEFFQQALTQQLPLRSLQVQHPNGRTALSGADTSPRAPMRLQLPADFNDALLAEKPTPLQLVFPARSDQAERQALRGAVQVAQAQTRLMAYLLDNGELTPEMPLAERLSLVQQRTQSPLQERIELAAGDLTARANAGQHNVPAWLIFGMFFVMLPMANSFQREQQNGTLLRLRCLRLSFLTLILSKLPAYLLINLLQFALLLALGVWALPLLGLPALELPGAGWAYAWLAASLALATCSLGLAMAALARSTEQALLLSGGLNIILAAIGGIMVPKSLMPDLMRQLAEVSPMSWALDGFLTLLVGQGGVGDVAPYCLRLLLFAAVTCALGLFLFRRRLQETQWTTHY